MIRGDSGSWVIVTPTRTCCEVVGSVVARSPGKAYVVLLSHQLAAIQSERSEVVQHKNSTSNQAGISVSLPSPLRLLLDRAHGYYLAGNVAKRERCLQMVISLSKQGTLPNDPLAVTFKRALEDWERAGDWVRQIDFEQIIAIHGSDLEKDLQFPVNSQPASGLRNTIHYLRSLYQRILEELPSRNASEGNQLADGEPKPTREPSTVWPTLPVSTQQPILIHPGTLNSLYLLRVTHQN